MRQADLENILGQLLEAEDAGLAPSADELVQKYPEYAAELRDYLANRDLLHRFASRTGHESPPPVVAADDYPIQGPASVERLGDYELIGPIARGGMGVVYRARHTVVGRVVALKMIREGRFASETQRQRFLIEARAASRLDHPNIVPLYEVGEHDSQPYFTMKLVEGPSLADHLQSWLNRPRESARLVLDLARAVHYAHQRGIMHRDLKPANVLLEEPAPGGQGSSGHAIDSVPAVHWRPLIADFGLAKLQDSKSELTHSGDIIGTPAYMAPEQAAGSGHEVATTTDIYSLGAILFAVLTGRAVFCGSTPAATLWHVIHVEPESPRKLNPLIDRDLETICLKCLEKEPRRRYGSAEALADDLQRWLDHRPIHARRSGLWGHSSKWARRHPAAAALVVVATVAPLALLGGSLWYNARLETEITNVERERQRAQDNFNRAEDRELAARRHAYAAQMNLAYQAREAGQMARALHLLHAQVPQSGQRDLRSFDWYHLSHLLHHGLRQTIRTASGPVRGLHFSLDSRQLICGCADGSVRIRDLKSGNAKVWNGHKAPIRATAVSPGGDSLATLDEDVVLKVWNLPNGDQRFTKRPDGRPALFYTLTSMIAFSSDGNQLVWLGTGLEVLDAWDGQSLATYNSGETANAVAFTPDGEDIVAVTNSREILLLPRVGADQRPELLGKHETYVLQLAIAPDGRSMASSSEDGVVKVWDLKQRTQVDEFAEQMGAIFSLAFTPDGRSLASGGEDGAVVVRELESGKRHLYAHLGTVFSIAFSPDSSLMATGDARGYVRLWDQAGAGATDTLLGHKSLVYSLAFSPDGATLASGSQDKAVRLWDVKTGKERGQLRGHTGSVTSLAYSPDGSLLATGNSRSNPPEPGNEAGSVRLWDLASQQLKATIPAHEQATWGIAFSPDGQTFATAGYRDNSVKLWDAKSRRLLATLTGHPQRIWCVAFSPDGTLLASGSASDRDDEETVFIWDLATRTPRHRLQVRWVWSVAFSPDGRHLATGSEGGLVKLWNVATGRESVPIQGHTTAVKCVAFSPDGKLLASASADRTIRLWDVATGDERAALKGHDSSIFSLAFSPDGRTLASGDWGGTIRLWRAETPSANRH